MREELKAKLSEQEAELSRALLDLEEIKAYKEADENETKEFINKIQEDIEQQKS
jgi:hypothetical protein